MTDLHHNLSTAAKGSGMQMICYGVCDSYNGVAMYGRDGYRDTLAYNNRDSIMYKFIDSSDGFPRPRHIRPVLQPKYVAKTVYTRVW